MVVVCGDFHGEFSFVNKFLSKHNEITMILQCGDFGYWPRFHKKTYLNERGKIKKYDSFNLKNKNVKIFFCDGNHEDFQSLLELQTNEIMKNVFYMKRGSTLDLPDGRTVLFIGGALSIDKKYRTFGYDWFPEETIKQKDIYELPEKKIDIVISHTAPSVFKTIDYHLEIEDDPSREALNYVLNKYNPKLWYFGHMHRFQQGFEKGCKWTCILYWS